jgi:hypothetical protein
MKYFLVVAITAAAFAQNQNLAAQEATPKPVRKSMSFSPGAITPIATKPAAAKAPEKAAAATPKATPSAAAKVAQLAAEQPADSSTPSVITSTVPPEPAQIVRAFFGLLGKGDIDGAYANLMKGSKIGERPEEVKTLKTKTKDAIEIFGVIRGYDLVNIKPVGDRLMRATYLSLGHDLPLRWRFYFYKADAEWKLIDLRVDDKLTGIFEEAPEEPPRPESRQ